MHDGCHQVFAATMHNMIVRELSASRSIRSDLLRRTKRLVSASTPPKTKKRKIIDETSIAGAQHRASMSGPSLGYLISELSATRPGMEALRREGHTMSEEHRMQQARRVVK